VYIRKYHFWFFKKIIDNYKKRTKYGDSRKANLFFEFGTKKLITDATFIHSDPGYAKGDKLEEMKPKKGEANTVPRKKSSNHTLNIIFIF